MLFILKFSSSSGLLAFTETWLCGILISVVPSTLSRSVETSLILSENQSKLQNWNPTCESFYAVDVIFTAFENMTLEHFRIFVQLFCDLFLTVLLFDLFRC